MKKTCKKEWGILGILFGSMLIVGSLLTIVGVGSGDTYAASVNYTCSCPDNSWTRTANICSKNVSITTIDPSSLPGYSCDPIGTIPGIGKTQYRCTYNDSQKCTCPDGGSLNDSGICVVIGQCPAGTYYIGDRSLSLCPFGSYCPGGTYNIVTGNVISGCGKIKCPVNAVCKSDGEYGASGFECKDGFTLLNGQCEKLISCPPGTYYTGQSNCSDCPTDSYCPGGDFIPDVSTSEGKYACPANASCNGVTFTCNAPDYEINSAGDGCEKKTKTCKNNQYEMYGVCFNCPDNATCDGFNFECMYPYKRAGSKCIWALSCPLNYGILNGISCEPCPANKPYSPGGTTLWSECSEVKPESCTSVGASCTLNGKAGTCIKVDSSVGLVCKINSESGNGDASGGEDDPSGVEDDFVFCAKGKYYSGQGSCSNCLAGSYCPGGLFKASSASGGIYACPANATCPAGSGDFVCNESAGYVKSGDTCVKKTSTNCIAGKYKSNGSCQDCPGGNFYCPGDNIIYGCPEGADCTSTGFECKTSEGYVKSGNTCVKKSDAYCNEGFYPKKDEATGNVSCALCPSGSWCPGGSVINSCPKGKTSNSGAKGESDCWDPTSVTAGATCDAGTYYDGNYGCLSCPGGFYCPGGTYSHSKGDINGSGRFKCPSEKPDSDANSSNLSDCKAGLGALEPVNPIGGDEPSGVEDDFVFCAKGKYYAGQGSCSNCLVGSYCPGGLFKASAVSGGIYACPANATCPAGSGDFVCNESAGYVKSGDTCVKKTSTNCIAGKYKINGSCQDCPIGNFYCPGDNIIYGCPEGADCTSTGFTCNESKGYVKSGNTCVKKSDAYCNEGFYPKKDEATGNVSCALCPSGSWCPGGSVINSCPKGKTSNSGAKGESDCWDPTSVTAGATCDAGTYYDGNYGCLSCPGGFYCPGGTYSHSKGDINGSGRFKCPSGKPNSGANSSSLSDCKTGLGGGTSGGGTSGGGTSGGRSDVITNPNTSTKTPLVIAVLGILSLGVGTFTYSSGKKEIDIEL